MPQGADTRLFLVVHTPSVRLLTGMSLLSFVDSQAAKKYTEKSPFPTFPRRLVAAMLAHFSFFERVTTAHA